LEYFARNQQRVLNFLILSISRQSHESLSYRHWSQCRIETIRGIYMSFQKCIFQGNMTRQPELRHTPRGAAVAEFGLGLNRRWKDEAGADHEEVTFLNCVAFGRTAETISEWFTKGDPILLEARAKQEEWTDKQSGQKRTAIKFIVESFSFCGEVKKKRGDSVGTSDAPPRPRNSAPTAREQARGQQQGAAAAPEPAEPIEDDAIPF
jgi:single-strand DNA-binding protein